MLKYTPITKMLIILHNENAHELRQVLTPRFMQQCVQLKQKKQLQPSILKVRVEFV